MNRVNIERFLSKIEKPGRYIGEEINSIKKDPDEVSLKFVFAFPDFYEIGMSYIGMQILYNIINKEENLAMERAFVPGFDLEKILREEDIPLFSLENKIPLKDFDVLGITLQHEMSYTTILSILDLSKLPLLAKDRTEEDPIVIGGGPASFNPEPLCQFFDLFNIGDGEEALVYLLNYIDEAKKAGKSKAEIIDGARTIKGVYVATDPWSEKLVVPAEIPSIEEVDYPTKPIVPLIEIVQDRGVIETFKGCTRGCRFCQAGMITRPVRERSKEKLIEIFNEMLKHTGHEEVSLLSLSTSDYSEFEPLVDELMKSCNDNNVSLSLPSLRLDSFSFNVLDQIQKYKKSGLTFAPEAGSQRLRNVINKSITEEHIYSAMSQAMDLGWKQVKLYFMIGLPTETNEDLDGILEIAEKIQSIYKEKGLGGSFNVNISVANFVPKPHTPFQWFPQNTAEEFKEKHIYLSKILRRKGISFSYHDSYISHIECLLARGDRSTGNIILDAYKNGCKLDGWSEHFNREGWQEAIDKYEAETGIKIDKFTTNGFQKEELLPWDTINTFVTKEYLLKEYTKANNEVLTLDCRTESCNGCTTEGERTKPCQNM